MTAGARNEHRMMLLATAGDGSDTTAGLTELAGGVPTSLAVELFVVGALGEHTCEALGADLLELAAASRRVIVDLSEVSRLSAAGFALLLRMHQILASGHGRLEFVAMSPAAREVLDILNWQEVSHAIVEFDRL